MNAQMISNMFEERMPIMKQDLREVLKIKNNNSFNQALSYLVSFGVLKRYENGIYYIPSDKSKFSHLEPSLSDILQAKYMRNDEGIRTGAYLLYKYKFSSQVSSFYEILSNNVSPHTRSKKLYNNKVIVSYPPFMIDKNNRRYLEFLEIIKLIHYSDFEYKSSEPRVKELINQMGLDKEELIKYSKYYNGRRYAGFRARIKEIFNNETA